jgi:hypothetical protein
MAEDKNINNFSLANNNEIKIEADKKQTEEMLQPMPKVTIHTMKSDLANSNNPEFFQANYTAQQEKISPDAPSDHRKANPFTSQAPIVPNPETPAAVKSPGVNDGEHFKTMLIIGIIVLLLLGLGFGAYYYWTSRNVTEIPENIPNPPTTQAPNPTEEPEATIPNPTPAPISATTPNYLMINLDQSDQSAIKDLLSQNADKVTALNVFVPVEFIITDSQNNPISFSTFAQKLGLTLSPDVLAQLGDKFSLYIYSENKIPHLGLSIELKSGANQTQFKDLMLKEEANLAQELQSLFLVSDYTITNQKFSTNSYQGIVIRYLNILSPQQLSADYSVLNNKLLIATSKESMLAIIDKDTTTSGTKEQTSTSRPTISSSSEKKSVSNTTIDKDVEKSSSISTSGTKSTTTSSITQSTSTTESK